VRVILDSLGDRGATVSTAGLGYQAPVTLDELLSILSELGSRARVIAGGTDLVPAMHKRKLAPEVTALVSLKNLPLRYIRPNGAGLVIGAATTHAEIASSAIVAREAPFLATASGMVGSPQIRNVATVGGNICNAGPSADTAAPLMALDARLRVVSRRGERMVPIREFYRGPSRNCLEPDEALLEILVPELPPHSGTHYVKFSPRSFMDLAWVGVAVVVCLDSSLSRCDDVRIGLSAVAPSPMRATRSEAVLRGREITDDLVAEMAQVASEECEPNPGSRRVPAWYRREMVAVLTRRGFDEARRIAAGEPCRR
jgi:CO/xanthine dehydrogenase FAD-binding subunit